MALGPNSIRHFLYGINFLFVLSGIIITAHGLENLFFFRHYGDLLQPQYTYISYYQLIIGLSIFLVSILGWYGALAESSFITLMFSSCLLLIFFMESAAGIGAYFLHLTTHHSLTVSLRLPNGTDDYESIYRWERLQNDLECCGVQKPSDWLSAPISSDGDFILPNSCCFEDMLNWKTNECLLSGAHKMGCFVLLENEIQENCLMIILLGFSIATFQLVGMIITCYLSSEFRKGYSKL